MKKDIFILSIISPLIMAGCATKKCGENDYTGLWNALTCKYSEREKDLNQEVNIEIKKEKKLFIAYQELLAEVTDKEHELEAYKSSVNRVETSILEAENILNKIATQKYSKNDIRELKKHLVNMKRNIEIKQVHFTTKDIELTKAYLNRSKTNVKLSKNKKNDNIKMTKAYMHRQNNDSVKLAKAYESKKLDNIKLAKAYMHRQNNDSVKLAKAYEKAYIGNQNNKIYLATKLSNLIDKISDSEKSGKINVATSDMLIASLSETKKYNNSIK